MCVARQESTRFLLFFMHTFGAWPPTRLFLACEEYNLKKQAILAQGKDGSMEFNVRVYWGDKIIEKEKLKDVVINSPVIDRIINRAIKEAREEKK